MSDYTGEILYDIRRDNDKEVNWRLHRLLTLRLAQVYKRNKSPKYKRIIDCAAYLEFKRFPDNSLKLKSANFCQTRLCPTCNWRRSKRVFSQISNIVNSIQDNYEFVFLTLTVKNTEGEYLNEMLNSMMKAYKLFCLRKRIKDSVRGWVKCFEITYNWKTAEYHPHFHCILAVDKDYFTTDKYLEQDEICEIWQSCLKVDYKPIVDVRVLSESEKGKGKEVAEVAKYTIKSSNIMANLRETFSYSKDIQDTIKNFTDAISDKIVLTLDSALENRRLIEYGGIFKKKHKQLNLSDDISSAYVDLIHTETKSNYAGIDYSIEHYRWDIGNRNYIRID
jgi:plasmid rolling circle replication initiator protein Rep